MVWVGQGKTSTSINSLFTDTLVPVLMDAGPFYNVSHPLRFRGISDSLALNHLEGSECCLIHVDNPLTVQKGVWLNLDVRVGYSLAAYQDVHRRRVWPTIQELLFGTWVNRLRCWLTTSWFRKQIVQSRLQAWGKEAKDNYEEGVLCLVDEMQVLVSNGWKHM